MKVYKTDEFVNTSEPKPFGEPIDGKQAYVSDAKKVTIECVAIDDVINWLKIFRPKLVTPFKHQLRRK